MRWLSALLLFVALVLPGQTSAASCSFVLGFATLHNLIPSIVGSCAVDEHHNPDNGDGLQETTGVDGKGGLLVWRKADNWTAYTDGYHTWINGPYGLQERLNTDRFPWEGTAPPAPVATPVPPLTVTANGFRLTNIRGGWGHDAQGIILPALFFTATNSTSGNIGYPDDRMFFSATFTDPARGATSGSVICSSTFLLSTLAPGGSGDVQCWGYLGYKPNSFTVPPTWQAHLFQGNYIAGSNHPMGSYSVSGWLH